MIKELKVGIVDYGAGNLYSVQKAFTRFTDKILIINKGNSVTDVDALVIPGVGSFKTGMDGIRDIGKVDEIRDFAKSGKPIMGICLGAQLLLTEGHEFGTYTGLNIIPGIVDKIETKRKVKIPHIGWNTINERNPNSWKNTILDNLTPGEYTYFVHSFVCTPEDENYVVSVTEYGGKNFCSAFEKDNVSGLQFHPEKSGSYGLKIIENFLKKSL